MAEYYMIFIMERAALFEGFTAEQWHELDLKHIAFSEAVAADGAEVILVDPLEAPSPGARLTPSPDGGPAIVTDGPYAETKEIVLGYYKLKVRDEAQARKLAALCPTAGWVELRKVMTAHA